MSNNQDLNRLRCLLIEALAWLDDYGARMSGTADLADRIKAELEKGDDDETS